MIETKEGEYRIFGKQEPHISYYDRYGVYVVLKNENGDIAVVKTPKGCFLIGGGIEGDENHQDCLLRECLEETGYQLEITGYLGWADIYGYHENLGAFHPVQYYYTGQFLSKKQKPVESDHQLIWLSYPDVLSRMYVEAQAWAIETAMTTYEGGTK